MRTINNPDTLIGCLEMITIYLVWCGILDVYCIASYKNTKEQLYGLMAEF